MRIVIVGAGKLGYSIAQILTEDDYDVVVVEIDEARREVVKNSLDVLTILGNGCSPNTLDDPDIRDADVLIASTDSDEVNMVTCMLAKNYGIERTVARIRNTDYALSAKDLLKQGMNIDLILNPERITAKEIDRILRTPSALDVDEYADGRVKMIEIKMNVDSPFINVPLKDLVIPKEVLIGMLFRQNKMIIPHGNDVLLAGDNVYFIGKNDVIDEFAKNFIINAENVERVMIIGAGRTGRFLAPMLEEQGIFVKVIEKNRERCQMVAEKLEQGIVLCGDGTDIDLLVEEGVGEADVVVCITEDDKLNLLLALLAKHLGAKKTIVRVARSEYVELMEKVGIDIVLSARLLSSSEVLRFIRSGSIVTVSLLEGARAEALEIILPHDCMVIGRCLKDLYLPKECLVCAIVRNNEVIIPNGNTMLLANDRIILFVDSEYVKRVMPFFEGRN